MFVVGPGVPWSGGVPGARWGVWPKRGARVPAARSPSVARRPLLPHLLPMVLVRLLDHEGGAREPSHLEDDVVQAGHAGQVTVVDDR